VRLLKADTLPQGVPLLLRIAADYSSRDAIVAAAVRLRERGAADTGAFAAELAGGAPPADGGDATVPRVAEVDLIIRTGGEQRLSDFLLWESAYAELVFTKTMWPDFGRDDLRAAVDEFHRRDRRYGGLQPARTSGAA
jgi:undecaprenyl diphosphate synthase